MNRKDRFNLATVSLALVAISLGVVFWWHERTYPYGHRTCALPCFMVSLQDYARDHSGWYPRTDDNKPALGLLYPGYASEGIAGLSHAIPSTLRALSLSNFTTNDSSWIYFEGLRSDDPGDVAIIYEGRGGIGPNGHAADGYAVGFAGGGHAQIQSVEWAEFTNNQAVLRRTVLSSRNADAITGTNAAADQ